jgi:hypothetical protein
MVGGIPTSENLRMFTGEILSKRDQKKKVTDA